jgi:hypothetical protein
MGMLFTAALILGSPNIECLKYLPGTNEVLPDGVHLSRDQNVANLMRCYCEVVVPAEMACTRNDTPANCRATTAAWIRDNILSLMQHPGVIQPPRRWRVISIEP